MDQGFDVYAGDGIGLRIVADRGQWFVEVHPGMENLTAGGTTGWFTLEVWSSCLGSPIVLHDPRPTSTHQDQAVALESSWWLEPQLDFLQANFDQITAACSAERVETTIACLAAVQRKGSPFRPSSA